MTKTNKPKTGQSFEQARGCIREIVHTWIYIDYRFSSKKYCEWRPRRYYMQNNVNVRSIKLFLMLRLRAALPTSTVLLLDGRIKPEYKVNQSE
ncbi:hypothetical protein ALC53_08413 [Atta colombica]|uniref:Uncharacterized protein n=1 Tax=Atta colombica TaxID=520822 RepID=A0A195BA12_9HYME|nr:hypothetical protein ALC53_08413 [Atta colombica]